MNLKILHVDNKRMQGLKIGVTIGIIKPEDSIWTNGIKQNVLALYYLLQNSTNDYQVTLLNSRKIDLTNIPYLKGLNCGYFNDLYEGMDLIITIGAQIHEELLLKFKSIKPNNKVVKYSCSFMYILMMESILFSKEPKEHTIEKCYDEVWYIPQVHENSCGYFHTLYRTNCLPVPFIWHSKFLTDSVVEVQKNFINKQYKKGYEYDSKKDKKVLGVLEPNLNTTKFCLLPTMIAEESYRTAVGKNKIEKIMLTNALTLKDNKEFLSLLKTLDLYKDGKITAESRYQTAFVVSQHIDIVLCHQASNPLNYLYLDVAYMGYPLLHNATMCKDLGYYYEGSDTQKAGEMLNWILENHDNNLKAYQQRTDKVIHRYSTKNPELVKTYDKLIYNLYHGGNHDLVYDETTNGYKE